MALTALGPYFGMPIRYLSTFQSIGEKGELDLWVYRGDSGLIRLFK